MFIILSFTAKTLLAWIAYGGIVATTKWTYGVLFCWTLKRTSNAILDDPQVLSTFQKHNNTGKMRRLGKGLLTSNLHSSPVFNHLQIQSSDLHSSSVRHCKPCLKPLVHIAWPFSLRLASEAKKISLKWAATFHGPWLFVHSLQNSQFLYYQRSKQHCRVRTTSPYLLV